MAGVGPLGHPIGQEMSRKECRLDGKNNASFVSFGREMVYENYLNG